MFYSRSTHRLYQKRKKATGPCPFCTPAEIDYRLREKTKHSYVISNQTSYEVWENHKVIDHLMVIPRHHVSLLHQLNNAEQLDLFKLIAKYEADGYSVYARGNNSPRRSVSAHQHTHLIKIDQQQPRFTMYLRRPYLLINL